MLEQDTYNKLKIGDVILAKSFCPCDVKVKLTRKGNDGWYGIIRRKKDIKCLNRWSVPISSGDETFVFDYHFIKKFDS